MKQTILKICLLTIIAICIHIPFCYASGANVSVSKTNVEPGETIEMYINLTTESIGCDLNINISENSNLISSAKLVSNITKGNASRIYLIQIEDRKIFQPGTKIATIKYTISENAKEGDKIRINVNGEVAGKTSSEHNTMSDSAIFTVIKKEKKDEPEKQENKNETSKEENSRHEESVENNINNNNNIIKEKTKKELNTKIEKKNKEIEEIKRK